MAATGNTIPADGASPAGGIVGGASAATGVVVGGASAATGFSRPFGSRLTPLLQGAIVLALSGLLFYLAYPRLHAALVYLPVDTAINRYYDTGEVQSAQLEGLQQRAREAIEINPHHHYLDGLSLLYHLQAADPEQALYRRREAFEFAITAAEDSLERAPAQPRTWLRVAQARSWLRYPPEQVIDALKMAIFTGRVEPSMFMTRLDLGLAYLPRMDAEGQAMMRDQVLLAWALQQRQLARALKSGELRLAGFETLLADAHEAVLNEIREAAGGAAR